jgi:phosphoglycolate phosphatase-like HAD superfamily hydrolase
LRIAIDFDNTIVSYGASFVRAAVELGFLGGASVAGKTAVRDAVRGLADGEEKWRRLQRVVYGPAIGAAPPFPGARAFVGRARAAGATLFLVSHKSSDLRAAAADWLRANDFIGAAAFEAENFFFEETRAAKIARLVALRCTHAIDDLGEVFAEPAFPPVERLLFAPDGAPPSPWRTFASWAQLADALFPDG